MQTADVVVGGIYKTKMLKVRVVDVRTGVDDPKVRFVYWPNGTMGEMRRSQFLLKFTRETRGRKRKTDFNLATGR